MFPRFVFRGPTGKMMAVSMRAARPAVAATLPGLGQYVPKFQMMTLSQTAKYKTEHQFGHSSPNLAESGVSRNYNLSP